MSSSVSSPLPFPLKEADRCVMCGMCLAYCPTYSYSQNEGESPRGRIALMVALAKGELAPTAQLQSHVDRCLGCRACERVCPSGVPYGQLLDAGRAYLAQVRPAPSLVRWQRRLLLDGLVVHPKGRFLTGKLLRLLQSSGLIKLAPLVGLGQLARRLPPLSPPGQLANYYLPQGKQRGRVALFTGCLAQEWDWQTLAAAITVLTRLGYWVDVPVGQGCCGALHLHSGEPQRAAHLARHNLTAFHAGQWEAVITTASGCGATLREYPQWLQDDERAGLLAAQIVDISEFLSRQSWPLDLFLRPFPQRVAVHDPCSLVNVLRQGGAPYRLLQRIPGIELIPLAENNRCCGAAGSHVVTEPAQADSLRKNKITALGSSGAQVLVSANIGCALHLAHGAREAGLAVEVMHPVALLARQLAEKEENEQREQHQV